jgi:hypothetical protein
MRLQQSSPIRPSSPARRDPRPAPQRVARTPLLAAAILALVPLVLAACESTTGSGSFTVGPAATNTAAAANATATSVATSIPVSPTAGGYSVKVYFSKHPDSDNKVTDVFSVKRVSPTIGVATYSIQQLIAGPTASEKASGYYTELAGALSGASTCGGADFQITLNTHVDAHTGTASPQQGTAVLRFCRSTSLPGDLSGGRITAQVNATLTQFSTIKKVQILEKNGSCFDDLSGQNNC